MKEENSGKWTRRKAMMFMGTTSAVGLAGCTGENGDDSAQSTESEAETTEFELIEASIPEIHETMASGALSAEDLTAAYLDRIEEYDEELNSFLHVNDGALERARELDEELENGGPVGPLHGIPLVLKDNFDTGDMPTTGGSLTMDGVIPPDDANTVQWFRDAGAVIIGKANMHEFAYSWETYSSQGGQTPTPYTLEHVSGGSSGGSAAAVAANLATVGTGSDTCGSNRIPPAFTNTVGLRGTLGLISRDGIMPMSTAQDIGGPITRTVTDQAIMLDVMARYDPDDPSTARTVGNIPVSETPPITTAIGDSSSNSGSYTDALDEGALDDAIIGVAREYIDDEGDGEPVADVVEEAIETMEAAGATIIDPVEVPPDDNSVTVTEFHREMNRYLSTLDDPNAPENLAEIVADEDNVHPGVLPSLENSLDIKIEELDENVDYLQDLVKRDLYRVMDEAESEPGNRQQVLVEMAEHDLDAIMYPSSTIPPVEIPEDEIPSQPGDSVNCSLSAGTGLPALCIPAGFTDDGLPVGIELLGRQFSEEDLLAIAYSFEQTANVREPPEEFGAME